MLTLNTLEMNKYEQAWIAEIKLLCTQVMSDWCLIQGSKRMGGGDHTFITHMYNNCQGLTLNSSSEKVISYWLNIGSKNTRGTKWLWWYLGRGKPSVTGRDGWPVTPWPWPGGPGTLPRELPGAGPGRQGFTAIPVWLPSTVWRHVPS